MKPLAIILLISTALAISGCGASNTNQQTFDFQGEGHGCGNIFVYTTNEDNTAGISLSADAEKLGLSGREASFDIGSTDGLRVEILLGQRISSRYCNDISYDLPNPKILTAKSGRVRITTSNIDTSLPRWARNYRTNVLLEDAHFFDERGDEAGIVQNLLFENIRVGWLPG